MTLKEIIIYGLAIYGLINLIIFLPQIFGYSFTVVDPRTHSMDDSLGIGIGLYKDYKSGITANIVYSNYLNGNHTALRYPDDISLKKELEIGDIIIFYKEGKRIMHQVVGKYETMVETKGTNNFKSEYVNYQDIKGRLVFWLK